MVYFVDDPNSKWELDVRADGEHITITGHNGARELIKSWCVSPPNFIESFFGITFERKLEKTKKKAQLKIDKLNEAIDRSNKVIGIKSLDFSNPPRGGSGYPSKKDN